VRRFSPLLVLAPLLLLSACGGDDTTPTEQLPPTIGAELQAMLDAKGA